MFTFALPGEAGEVNVQGLTKEDATRMMNVSRKQTESVVKELLRKVSFIKVSPTPQFGPLRVSSCVFKGVIFKTRLIASTFI